MLFLFMGVIRRNIFSYVELIPHMELEGNTGGCRLFIQDPCTRDNLAFCACCSKHIAEIFFCIYKTFLKNKDRVYKINDKTY